MSVIPVDHQMPPKLLSYECRFSIFLSQHNSHATMQYQLLSPLQLKCQPLLLIWHILLCHLQHHPSLHQKWLHHSCHTSSESGISYREFCFPFWKCPLAAPNPTQNDDTQISTLPYHILTLCPKLPLAPEHDYLPSQQVYQIWGKWQQQSEIVPWKWLCDGIYICMYLANGLECLAVTGVYWDTSRFPLLHPHGL